MLRGLAHDNIVRLLDAFRCGGRLFLVFELAEQTILQVPQLPQPLCTNLSRPGFHVIFQQPHLCHCFLNCFLSRAKRLQSELTLRRCRRSG